MRSPARALLAVLVVGTLASALMLASTGSASAASIAVSGNRSVTLGDTTLAVEPINEDGIRYVLPDARIRLWKKDDCVTFGFERACLTSASTTGATFTTEFLGAELDAEHTVSTTSVPFGDEATGTVTLRNDQPLPATDVVITLRASNGAVFTRSGTGTLEVRSPSVETSFTTTYAVRLPTNGSTTVSGTMRYGDANRTVTETIDNRTVAYTLPFTYAIGFDPLPARNRTMLSVNLTRRTDENVSVTIRATLPPQAVIDETLRRTTVNGQVLTSRDTLDANTTRMNLTAWYALTGAPTADVPVTIEYRVDDGSRRVLPLTLAYRTTSEAPVSLGVQANATRVDEPSYLTVLVTGNVSGTLVVASEVLNETRQMTSGVYALLYRPLVSGTFPVSVRFAWRDAWDTEHAREANATVTALPAMDTADTLTTDGNATDTAEDGGIGAGQQPPGDENASVPADEPTVVLRPDVPRPPYLAFALSGVVIGCLVSLALLLRRVHEPLRRAERLLARTAELRAAYAKRAVTPHEREQLEALERELASLRERLK